MENKAFCPKPAILRTACLIDHTNRWQKPHVSICSTSWDIDITRTYKHNRHMPCTKQPKAILTSTRPDGRVQNRNRNILDIYWGHSKHFITTNFAYHRLMYFPCNLWKINMRFSCSKYEICKNLHLFIDLQCEYFIIDFVKNKTVSLHE